ncbi:MAG: SdrD B-like domain-containing protein [Acidimicrobiales bacterium]
MIATRQRIRRLRGDDGFTLPELIITSVILSVIMASIGAAIIVALRTQERPATKLGPSNDANLLASYFLADVQSASVTNTAASAPSGCNYVTPADTSNVVALSWTDNAPTPPVARAAAYQWHAPTRTLRRVSCLVGQVPSVAVLARHVTAAAAAVSTSVGSIRLDITALDPQAPVGELPFTFRLRGHGRLAGNDSGGGSGSGSGANQLPTTEILGSVTRYSDAAGTTGAAAVAGLPVSLTQGSTVVTRNTGTDGKYYFGSLADGTYTVALPATLPGGLAPTTGEPVSRAIVITSGVITGTPDLSFGLWLPLGSVSGKVRLNNVAQTAIANVTVSLSGPVSPLPAPVTTTATGAYTFPNLPSGAYTVTFSLPLGHTLVSGAPCNVTVAAPSAATCPDTVYNNGANTISGVARLDTNGNGTNDASDKPRAGVTVTATAGSTVLTAVTAADGSFQFPGLANATYTVSPGSESGLIVVPPASVTRIIDGVAVPAPVTVLLQACTVGIDVNVARGNGANANVPANNERISMSATLRPGCPAIPVGTVSFRFLPAGANYPGGPPAVPPNFTVNGTLALGVYTSATLNSAVAVWTPGDTRVEVLAGTTKIGELVVVVT